MPPQQRPPPPLSFSTLPLSHQYPFPPTNGDFCQTLSLATRVPSCLLVLHTPFLQFLILCLRLSCYFVLHLSVTLLPQFPLSPPQELLPCCSLASTSGSQGFHQFPFSLWPTLPTHSLVVRPYPTAPGSAPPGGGGPPRPDPIAPPFAPAAHLPPLARPPRARQTTPLAPGPAPAPPTSWGPGLSRSR